MSKKKNINILGVVFGLFLLYLGTYIFLVNTSNNNSVKDYTYINKVIAKFQFFQDQNGNITPYNQTNNTLFNGKWASSNYPLQGVYSTGLIKNLNNPQVITKGIGAVSSNTTNTSYIYIRPPRRHSH